jgi:hypothetical protein
MYVHALAGVTVSLFISFKLMDTWFYEPLSKN